MDYVLVTGGSRGIGRAVVLRFAREGFAVLFTYKSNIERAREVAKEAASLGARCVKYVQMDLSDLDSIRSAVSEIASSAPYINVLVNNAGILHLDSLETASVEDIEVVVKVNLLGTIIFTKLVLPLMKKAPWASIVNVASIAGETGNVYASTVYAATKAGIIGFTKRLAVEVAPKVRVNAVAPSFVETDMVREFLSSEEKRKQIVDLHPLKIIIKPEDVAEAIFFLASPKLSRAVTGHVLRVNAGRFT
jgi:3-oxoacyl-[acyl-carrier protein] reductase